MKYRSKQDGEKHKGTDPDEKGALSSQTQKSAASSSVSAPLVSEKCPHDYKEARKQSNFTSWAKKARDSCDKACDLWL